MSLPTLGDMLTGGGMSSQQQILTPQQQNQPAQPAPQAYVPQPAPQPYVPQPAPQPYIPQPVPAQAINPHFDLASRNGGTYVFPGEQKNMVCYGQAGGYYLSIANSFKWAHNDNKSYWEKRQVQNQYDTQGCYFLKNVCWLEIVFGFNKVARGDYQLLIHHGFAPGSTVRERMKLSLTINDKEVYSIPNFSCSQEYKSAPPDTLFEDPVIAIRDNFFKQVDPQGTCQEYKIYISLMMTDGNWKKGYYIDGAKLIAC